MAGASAMRRLGFGAAPFLFAGVLAALLAVSGRPADAPAGLPPLPPPGTLASPDSRARQAAHFLAAGARAKFFAAGDEPYLAFLYWDALEGVPELPRFKLLNQWWLNQLSFEQLPGLVNDVPGTAGMLQWLDIRDFGWCPDALVAVARREPYTREPWVTHAAGEYLRRAAHLEYLKPGEDGTLPVVTLLRADWLFRETVESDRSTSYYDLLYSRWRFGKAKARYRTRTQNYRHHGGPYTEPAGSVDEDGRDVSGRRHANLPAGVYEVRVRERVDNDAAAVSNDFPENLQEFQRAFGVDLANAYQSDTRIFNTFGAVVDGGRDFPRTGSIVALNNRLVLLLQALTRPGAAPATLTFDVFETSGRRDYREQIARLPFLVLARDSKYRVVFDAGEALFPLPNGGTAGYLFNNRFERTEIAAQKAANTHKLERRLGPGVRNPGDCFLCHAPSAMFNVPMNAAEEITEAGVDVVFPDEYGFTSREARNRFVGFYLTWKEQSASWGGPFNALLARTTRERPPAAAEWEAVRAAGDARALVLLQGRARRAANARGWDGAELVKVFSDFRNWYDDPLRPAQMAREIGLPLDLFRNLAVRATGDPHDRGSGVQLKTAARGLPMARSAWEKNQYRNAGLLLDLSRRPAPPKKRPYP